MHWSNEVPTTLRSRMLKATSIWDRRTAPETKNKTRIFNEESRLHGYAWWDMHTSSNDIRRRNTGTHQPNKEQASRRTNKDGKEYVKHHILYCVLMLLTCSEYNVQNKLPYTYRDKKHLDKRKDKGHRRDWTSQKTEVDLGRARQQNTRLRVATERIGVVKYHVC